MPQVHNHDVADLFREMADLLHIRGGEPHRVRAFQRVAQIVEALPQPVDKMIRFGTLQRTPNIGDGSVHRIKQILRTGTCDDLSRLRAQVPAGLRDLLSLKGLGPSSVRQLHQQLGIADLDQLELAAKDGRLRQLPRFGIDAVHGLLREIEVRRANRGKVPLVVALRAFEEIATRLRDVDGAVTVVPGGSCRRRREMIGDLDVLVESANPKPLIEAFMTLPSAREVLMRREDGGSIRLATLQQADLRVFAPETWGAGLHHFTGSKEHNVALRTRAGRLGLHISENGISDRATDRRLSLARTEEEIYAAVGMPYIPPELREHRGEIEAALDGRLPRLITAEDLRGDLHMHSTDSDGEADARTMALTAAKLGFEYLAITDHSQTLEVAGGLDERRVLAQGEKLRKVESELDRIHVLWGIEVDILADGTLDLDLTVLSRLDWVVASVHSAFDLDADAQTARLIRAMETGVVDVLGHPTARKLGKREGISFHIDRVFDTARRLGVALEVNGKARRMDLNDILCRRARDMGVMLVLDTDAHEPAALGGWEFALAAARRGWIEPKHVLNTRPIDELFAWRRDRLRRLGLPVPERLLSTPRSWSRSDSPSELAGPEVVEPMPSPTLDDSATDELARALDEPLDDALRERLQTFLHSGDDPELDAALRRRGDNPVQEAFNLIIGARP